MELYATIFKYFRNPETCTSKALARPVEVQTFRCLGMQSLRGSGVRGTEVQSIDGSKRNIKSRSYKNEYQTHAKHHRASELPCVFS